MLSVFKITTLADKYKIVQFIMFIVNKERLL